MKTFKVNDRIEIVCDWKKTSYGFKHTANLLIDGEDVLSAKACYWNRTWESYEYQSVMQELISKATAKKKGRLPVISEQEAAICNEYIANYKEGNPFGALTMIAKLGDILCEKQEEKNKWKERMMKAGLGENMMLPPDWDQLSEEEKEKRLNGAIEILEK